MLARLSSSRVNKVLCRYAVAVVCLNRAFLRRAVGFAAEAGIRQFLDIGSGFPTVGNVHEIAQDARVVYVDLDLNAVRHGRFMLAGNPRTSMIQGDVHEIDSILDDAAVRELIDFGKPVAVLVLALFHFVPGDVSGIIGRLHEVGVQQWRPAPGDLVDLDPAAFVVAVGRRG
jgi:hypothetical protein